jgi:hypothetical protein
MLRVSLLLYSVPGSQLLLPNARHLIRTGANKPDEAGPAELPIPGRLSGPLPFPTTVLVPQPVRFVSRYPEWEGGTAR